MRRSLVIWIVLNALRFISVVCMLLVFAATIQSMVLDGKALDATSPSDVEDCDYVPGTDVPTHAWGIFWAHLDRVFILILCLLGIFSEINWGGLCERVFHHALPIFSGSFGLGPLGALQMMIATNMLSHCLDRFPLVVSWMLFFVGLINLLLGLALGRRVKLLRSMSDEDRQKGAMPESRWGSGLGPASPATQGGDIENQLGRQQVDAAFVAAPWSDRKDPTLPAPAVSARLERDCPAYHFVGARPVKTLSEAFHSSNIGHRRPNDAQSHSLESRDAAEHEAVRESGAASPSYTEVMRARAREANERAERELIARRQQQQEHVNTAANGLERAARTNGIIEGLGAGRALTVDRSPELNAAQRSTARRPRESQQDSTCFVYDSEIGGPVCITRPRSRATDLSYNNSARPPTSVGNSIGPSQRSPSITRRHYVPAADRSGVIYRPTLRLNDSTSALWASDTASNKLKRRSLALAKMARRRLSAKNTAAILLRRNDDRHREREMPDWATMSSSATRLEARSDLRDRRVAESIRRQAERERERLKRLACELDLPSSAGANAMGKQHNYDLVQPPAFERWPTEAAGATRTAARASPSNYTSCAGGPDSHSTVFISSPVASTTGLTSVSRAQDRFGRDEEAEETFLSACAEPPLPVYQRSPSIRRHPTLRKHAGIGDHDSRLPIASQFASEWARRVGHA